MNKLQIALTLNVIFSSISWGILLFFSIAVAVSFDVAASKPFWIIGIALLFFAATLVYEIIQQNPLQVLWFIIQDFMWVIGSSILILFNPFSISSLGLWIIQEYAFVVNTQAPATPIPSPF